MQGSTHLATGVAVGIAAAQYAGVSDWKQVGICAAAAGVAALVPDWLQLNLPGASETIKGVFGHRGFSHWIWAALAVWYAVNGLSEAPTGLATAILAGYLSHIVLDVFSGGVPAFWPLPRITLAHIKTGESIDGLFGGLALILAATQIAERIL